MWLPWKRKKEKEENPASVASKAAIRETLHKFSLAKRAMQALGVNALVLGRDDDGDICFESAILPMPSVEVSEDQVVGLKCKTALEAWGASKIFPYYEKALQGEGSKVVFRAIPGHESHVVLVPLEGGKAIVSWFDVPNDEGREVVT